MRISLVITCPRRLASCLTKLCCKSNSHRWKAMLQSVVVFWPSIALLDRSRLTSKSLRALFMHLIPGPWSSESPFNSSTPLQCCCFSLAALFFATNASNLAEQNTPPKNIAPTQSQKTSLLTLTECLLNLPGTNNPSSTT